MGAAARRRGRLFCTSVGAGIERAPFGLPLCLSVWESAMQEAEGHFLHLPHSLQSPCLWAGILTQPVAPISSFLFVVAPPFFLPPPPGCWRLAVVLVVGGAGQAQRPGGAGAVTTQKPVFVLTGQKYKQHQKISVLKLVYVGCLSVHWICCRFNRLFCSCHRPQ